MFVVGFVHVVYLSRVIFSLKTLLALNFSDDYHKYDYHNSNYDDDWNSVTHLHPHFFFTSSGEKNNDEFIAPFNIGNAWMRIKFRFEIWLSVY